MIYIVEDDRSISEIESYSLKNSGYEVAVFENAASFYEALENQVPQLVLLDIMLPGIDGFEVCRRIRATNTKIGIIMLTARSQEMDKVTGLMTGADDYVTKPFSPAELTARVDALFRRAGGEEVVQSGEISQPPFLLNTRNRTLEKNGQRVALIGATRVIPKADWAATKGHPGMLSSYEVSVEPLLAQIAECHASGDKVVVLIHWGIERDEMPQEYQRALARRYIDAGADLVIGSHPHVLQGIEYYKGKPIFYSLGNFVFGSSIPKTMLVQAAFTGESLSLQLIPGTSSGGYTRMLTDAESKTQFYQYLEGISFGVSVGEDGIVSPQP